MILKPLIWPEFPTNLDRVALVLLTLDAPGIQARKRVREVLRDILSRLPETSQIEMIETARGPLLTGEAAPIRISLSYAGDKALIALAKDRPIGVDIVQVGNLPEIETLSRLYLPAATRLASLQESPDRDCRFALAWAQMEACCKCLNLPLAEINAQREHAYAACTLIDCEQLDGYRIAVALGAA